jgi:hypothetical protein
MKSGLKAVLFMGVVLLLSAVAMAQAVNMAGKWVVTGIDEEPGVIRLTSSTNGFQGVYTAGLTEDGYHCDIKDGKETKSGKVSFTFVCGADELEAKVTGHVTPNGSIKAKVNGVSFTMVRQADDSPR